MDLYKFHDNPEDLKGHDEADEIVLERVWKIAQLGQKLTPKQENVIAKNAYHAYFYAHDVIKGPWPKGEDAVARGQYWKKQYEQHFRVKL